MLFPDSKTAREFPKQRAETNQEIAAECYENNNISRVSVRTTHRDPYPGA